MFCLWKLAFVLSVLLIVENNGALIRSSEDILTKEVPVPKEDNNVAVEDNAAVPEFVDVDAVEDKTEDGCVAIGSFCMNHSDCCSNTCLGYMKRCVTGSG